MGPSHGVFDPKSIFLLFTSSCGGHEFKKLLLRARERGGIVSSHPGGYALRSPVFFCASKRPAQASITTKLLRSETLDSLGYKQKCPSRTRTSAGTTRQCCNRCSLSPTIPNPDLQPSADAILPKRHESRNPRRGYGSYSCSDLFPFNTRHRIIRSIHAANKRLGRQLAFVFKSRKFTSLFN